MVGYGPAVVGAWVNATSVLPQSSADASGMHETRNRRNMAKIPATDIREQDAGIDGRWCNA